MELKSHHSAAALRSSSDPRVVTYIDNKLDPMIPKTNTVEAGGEMVTTGSSSRPVHVLQNSYAVIA